MPAAIAAAAEVWGTIASTEIIGAGVLYEGSAAISLGMLIKGAVVVGGFVAANRAKQAARDSYNASLRDRTMMIRSPEAARRHIYGTTRAGGVIVYGCNSGTRKEYLHLVQALASHTLTGIDDIWLADKSVGTLDGSGNVQSSSIAWKAKTLSGTGDFVPSGVPYGANLAATIPTVTGVLSVAVPEGEGYRAVPFTYSFGTVQVSAVDVPAATSMRVTYTYDAGESRLQVVKFLGAAARDIPLETASAGQWTASHLGTGVARMRCTFKPDPDTFPNGLANVSAIVRGKAVYDPRTSTTVFSNNSALAVLDYLMANHGFRATLAEIDLPSFIAAANVCDEDVPTDTGTQKRYTADGVIAEDADRIEVLRGLLSSMVGEVAFVAGKWYVRAGAFYASEMTLDDGDFAGGDVTVTANMPRRSLFNGVKGRFIDPANLWAYSDFTPYKSATYQAEDGGEEVLTDVDLPFTTNGTRAQRIAKLILFKARQSLTMQATFKLRALAASPLTTIRVKLAEFGWDTLDGGLGKLFVVRERVFNPDTRTVTLTLQEEASAVYAWDYSEANDPDPSPNTGFKGPREIDNIAGLAVNSSASTYRQLKDGTIVPFALVSWTAITDALVTEGGNVRVAWKRANEDRYQSALLPGTATAYQIDGVGPAEVLNIGVQAINGAQVTSDWVWTAHTVSTSVPTNAQSPRFGLGVNLLAGAALKAGIPGWTAFAAGGYSATVTHIIGAAGAPKPFGAIALTVPSGSIASDVGVAAGDGLRIPVSPGQRIEGQARVQNFRGNARIQIEFHDASGTSVGTGMAGGVSATTADTASGSQNLADCKQLWGFATAPAGAVTAQLAVYTSRTSTSAATVVYIAQPYLGVAHDNQTLPGPWTDGPPRGALAIADLATTSLIAASAATEVSSSSNSSTTSVTTGTITPAETYVSVLTLTVTNPTSAAIPVLITGSGKMVGTSNSNGVSFPVGFVGVQIISATEWASLGTSWPSEPGSGFTVGGGETFTQSLLVQRNFVLGAGATETYHLYLVADYCKTADLSKKNLRAEMVKR